MNSPWNFTPPVLPRSLLLLAALESRARVRLYWRGLRSGRQRLFALSSLLVLGISLAFPLVLAHTEAFRAWRFDPAWVRDGIVVLLLLLLLGNLLAGSAPRQSLLHYSPAEVDFLWPAPYTPGQLLAYRWLSNSLGLTFNAAVFTIALVPFVPHPGVAFGGAWLALCFLDLVPAVLALVADRCRRPLWRWSALAIAMAIGGGVAADTWYVWQALPESAAVERLLLLRDSSLWQAARLSFEPFVQTIAAPRLYPEAVRPGGVAFLVDLGLMVIVLGLSSRYLETARGRGEKSRGTPPRSSAEGPAAGVIPRVRWQLKSFPYWRGIGPNAWRLTLTTLRRGRFGLVGLAGLGLLTALGLMEKIQGRPPPLALAVFLGFYLFGILSHLQAKDFRRDLHHLELLKTLPLHPSTLAFSELLPTLVFSTLLLWVYLGSLMVCFYGPIFELWAAACGGVSLNLFSTAYANLAFLLYPLRIGGPPKGPAEMGREMLVTVAQIVIYLFALALAFAAGAGVFVGVTPSKAAFWFTVWLTLTAMGIGLTTATGWAFRRLDLSRDLPPADAQG